MCDVGNGAPHPDGVLQQTSTDLALVYVTVLHHQGSRVPQVWLLGAFSKGLEGCVLVGGGAVPVSKQFIRLNRSKAFGLIAQILPVKWLINRPVSSPGTQPSTAVRLKDKQTLVFVPFCKFLSSARVTDSPNFNPRPPSVRRPGKARVCVRFEPPHPIPPPPLPPPPRFEDLHAHLAFQLVPPPPHPPLPNPETAKGDG